jgi:preprotein translocase subunit Sec61beta
MAEQMHVPASSGGLVRYFDEYKSKIQIKPEIVIGMIIAVIAFVIIMRKVLPVGA